MVEDPRFAQVEWQYARYRDAVNAGQMGAAQADAAVGAMAFELGGRYWSFNAGAGQWFASADGRWIAATPPGREVAAAGPTQAPPPAWQPSSPPAWQPSATPSFPAAPALPAAPTGPAVAMGMPYGYGPVGVTPSRAASPTVAAVLAGLLLVLLGLLWTVFCGAVLGLGRLESVAPRGFQGPVIPDASAGLLAPTLIALLVFGVIEVIVGILVWRGNEAARVVGIVYGVAFALLWVAGVAVGLPALGDSATVIAVVMIIVHAYVALSLGFAWKRRG
jgi:hypothetical protein